MSSKKVAVIGSGISGMAVAYLLHSQYDVTVFEKESYIGGHSRTIDLHLQDGTVPVDTGFIVFNRKNYPHLTAMFEYLQVPVEKSDMSFGVSIQNGWLEYGTRRMMHLLAQKRNVFRPQFWKMLRDIQHFNQNVQQIVRQNPDITIQECLDRLNLGEWFRRYYFLAMGAAIWSTSVQNMMKFPAQTLIQFFDNHGLLTINDQPQWYTVRGGSRAYVQRLTASFRDKIHLNRGIKAVTRASDGVRVVDETGHSSTFDAVVFACHSDQALALIQSPTAHEQQLLSSIPYQPNRIIVHRDTKYMPKRRAAWASWVYLSAERADNTECVSLTYWMNNLQPIQTSTPVLVTLNPTVDPDPEKTYETHQFHHPQFTAQGIAAQQQLQTIQGVDRLWFCGAWQRYGFHEDGIQSAVAVAQSFGVSIPWQTQLSSR